MRTHWMALGFTVCLAQAAHAAGFYFGDNGTKALMQGGAFAGQADDLTAIQHNPAGLVQLDGTHALFDVNLLQHDVEFLRKEPGGVTSVANPVRNQGGLFFLPFFAGAQRFEVANRPLTLAAGLYGPPSVGRYTFATPNYTTENGRYVEDPRRYAPQRYSLIHQDVVVLYPTLSVAYAFHPRFAAGVSLQYVYSHFGLSLTAYSGLQTPTNMLQEDPAFDSVVSIDLNGTGGVTGVLGVWARPLDNLSVGASVRPPIPMRAKGNFDIALGEFARNAGAVVTGDQAELALTFPLEARVGVHYKPLTRLGLNADVVFQGWSSFDELVLTPQNVSLQLGTAPPAAVERFRIAKRWRNSWSGRVGGGYAFDFGLSVHAGALYEQATSPDEYLSVDFAHFTRVFVTGGLGYRVGPVQLFAGGAYTPPQVRDITSTQVTAPSTFPDVPGSTVGLGTLSSGGWVVTSGVRGNFGGSR